MVLTALEKAGILIEALPYIRRFYGKTVVIKYGGHAMTDCKLKEAVVRDVILMKFVGMHPVLVHGGGPEITAMLERLHIPSTFVNGERVTDASTMEIVEMVLVGKVNKEIVALINRAGGKAVGLSGKDGCLIQASKKEVSGSDQADLGFVGQIVNINPEIIRTVIDQGYIPVVAPVGVGNQGEGYNINADFVAGALASALQADKLVLLTDVEGIKGPGGKILSSISTSQVPTLIREGIIRGGMIPKVKCCVEALENGISSAHIIDGRIPHSLLLEIFTDEGIGTMVTREKLASE